MSARAEEIFFEIHRDNPREGPGSFEATRKAYSALSGLPDKPIILDIGCGPGQQALDLASLSAGTIYAIDNYEPYLEALQTRVAQKGLADRVFPRAGDMNALPFEQAYFDVIWAEGSIYLMGFEIGLNAWRPFLKPSGHMAVSEISWLKDKPPLDLVSFWDEAYPALQDQDGNISIIQGAGYKVIDHFVLPPEAWWDNYYVHIENKLALLKTKYQNDAEALEVIAMEELEIDVFRKYSDYYGYVFYIMQKQ
ncbi:MAG: class I SAM-dependent methyltransferase [Deltaproteobacteria bacterium]|nr:class I SAM-dependent methyltransferase [Deltaproteobacteria bacterium]